LLPEPLFMRLSGVFCIQDFLRWVSRLSAVGSGAESSD